MEKKYYITTDLCARTTKPDSDWENQLIFRNLINKVEVSITDFGDMITKGYTWSGGLFSNLCTNDNWIQQSVIGLDFDKGLVTPNQVIERLKEFNVVPQLWYSTYSSTNVLLRFRVVLFLDHAITEIEIFHFIINTLLRIFPEADQTCKNPSRYYFGGTSYKLINNESTSSTDLLDQLIIYTFTNDSNSFRKVPQKVFEYIKNNFAQFPEILYNNNRISGFPADIISKNSIYHPTYCYQGKKLKLDFDELRTKFKLFDEFSKGTWLHHNQLFGLATNLKYVEGGLKLMKNTMLKYNKEGITKYTDNNFNILPYVKKVEYFTTLIGNFSPYPDDWKFNNIFDFSEFKRGKIDIIEPVKKISLVEAETLMIKKYNEVIKNGVSGKIYIFRLPTAIGKTEMILDTNATICLPTNDLKNEVRDRMRINSVVTPDRLVFSNEILNRKIDYYYRVGLPQVAMRIINSIALDTELSIYNEVDINNAKEYLEEIENSKSTVQAVITTHNRSFYTDFSHDTIIYDEDPTNMILNIKETKLSDILAINHIYNLPELNGIVNDLKNSNTNEVFRLNNYDLDIENFVERVINFPLNTNVIEFLSSQYYIIDMFDRNTIFYITKNNFPSDKKIIIMSATIPVYIYQKLYGERVEVIDISDVQQLGEVVQHTDRSCSRDGLKHYGKEVSALVGDLPVITFLTQKHLFKYSVPELHFGNCSGSDKYKGCDIAVVGTPHHNNFEYFLIASVLGLSLSEEDKEICNQIVEHNSYRFKFNSFRGEELRKIQFSLIEADLIQAVGRARTLRTCARVEVYSNYPLRLTSRFNHASFIDSK